MATIQLTIYEQVKIVNLAILIHKTTAEAIVA